MAILTPHVARTIPRHPGLRTFTRAGYSSRYALGSGPTPQVLRITLNSSTATEVTVTVTLGEDTETVAVTFAGSADATNSAALLVALKDNPVFAGFFASIAAQSATTIDLTGLRALEPVITVTGVGISVATAQAAAADPEYAYGRFYLVGSRTTEGNLTATQVAALSALAGPVTTFTATFNDAADVYSYSLSVQKPDGTIAVLSSSGSVGADLAAYLVALAADLEAKVPGSTTSTASPVVTWNLPAGYVVIGGEASATNSSDLVYALSSVGSAVPDIADVGCCENPMNDEFTNFSGGYATGRRASRGVCLALDEAFISVVVADGETPADGDDVWIETATGSTKHLAYPDPSPTRFLLKGARFVAGVSSDNLSIVEL